jgi:hypothetical protein
MQFERRKSNKSNLGHLSEKQARHLEQQPHFFFYKKGLQFNFV